MKKYEKQYKHWCQQLRRRREALELTQQEVAQRLALSRSHYSAIEHGRTVVNYHHLYGLAKVLGIGIADLFTGMTRRSSKQRCG